MAKYINKMIINDDKPIVIKNFPKKPSALFKTFSIRKIAILILPIILKYFIIKSLINFLLLTLRKYEIFNYNELNYY